jgi:hypothetical protein
MAGSSTDLVPAAKRSKVHHDGELRNLVALQHKTKTTIVETLTVLKDAGLLKEGVSRRDLQKASEHHSSQTTPYGKVVERMKLNATGLKYLDICNPFALLFYLSSMSVAFAALMTDAVARAGGRALRLIIYTDEMCPGNPYRPEKSRTLQCVYWAFADWPAHVLSRTFAWPCLCLIKSSTVANIEGGMSYVCRMLLRIFFPTGDGHSLSRGVMIPCGERSILGQALSQASCAISKATRKTLNGRGITAMCVASPAATLISAFVVETLVRVTSSVSTTITLQTL